MRHKADGKLSPHIADLMAITAPGAIVAQVDAMLRAILVDIPQVEVEVRVVELTDDEDLSWGISGNVVRGTVEEAARTFLKQGSFNAPLNLKEEAILNFSAIQDDTAVELFVEFIQTATNADITAAPRVVVMTGHRAAIDTGGETPILSPTVNSEGEVTSATVSFRPTGVILVITPFVLHDDLIQLEISAQVTAVTSQVTVAEFADGPLRNPVISKRNAFSINNLRSGQTVIFGGLSTNEEIEAETKVPVLGDIPLLGYLFKRKTKTRRTSRVIYLVKATIVRPGQTLEVDS